MKKALPVLTLLFFVLCLWVHSHFQSISLHIEEPQHPSISPYISKRDTFRLSGFTLPGTMGLDLGIHQIPKKITSETYVYSSLQWFSQEPPTINHTIRGLFHMHASGFISFRLLIPIWALFALLMAGGSVAIITRRATQSRTLTSRNAFTDSNH